MNRSPLNCRLPSEIAEAMTSIAASEDLSRMDLFHHLKIVARLLGHLTDEFHQHDGLSSARMRLLIRLAIAAKQGPVEGVSPSHLSRFAGVSRNTISSLLNGMEEHQLIERHVHPTDRRQFLVRITPAGEALVHDRAPQFVAFVSELFSPLSAEEQYTLMELLDKLLTTLVQKSAEMGLHAPQIISDAP